MSLKAERDYWRENFVVFLGPMQRVQRFVQKMGVMGDEREKAAFRWLGKARRLVRGLVLGEKSECFVLFFHFMKSHTGCRLVVAAAELLQRAACWWQCNWCAQERQLGSSSCSLPKPERQVSRACGLAACCSCCF